MFTLDFCNNNLGIRVFPSWPEDNPQAIGFVETHLKACFWLTQFQTHSCYSGSCVYDPSDCLSNLMLLTVSQSSPSFRWSCAINVSLEDSSLSSKQAKVNRSCSLSWTWNDAFESSDTSTPNGYIENEQA